LIRIIDVNGDGTMSREELVSGFGAYRAEISDRAIGSLIRRFDASKTGELNVQEFAKGILEFYEDHRFEFEQAATAMPCHSNVPSLSRAESEAKLMQSPLAMTFELDLVEPSQSQTLQDSPRKASPKSSVEVPESSTALSRAPLPAGSQCVPHSAVSLPSSENGEFEAQMLAKASYYHHRHGSGDSNGSDTACTDTAITVSILPGRSIVDRCEAAPDTAGQWGPEEFSSRDGWPVFAMGAGLNEAAGNSERPAGPICS
jgi:hypothetical protein